MGWSMDRVHGVVHRPRSMFCILAIEVEEKVMTYSELYVLETTQE